MPEIPDPGTDSTDKCSAIIDVSILSTLDEHQKRNRRKGEKTGSKLAASGTNVSSVRPADPLPMYLVNELSQLSFHVGEQTYQVDDTEHPAAWEAFVAEYAEVDGSVDWADLEERAHFLNTLYAYCQSQQLPFPIEEKAEIFNEKLNER